MTLRVRGLFGGHVGDFGLQVWVSGPRGLKILQYGGCGFRIWMLGFWTPGLGFSRLGGFGP